MSRPSSPAPILGEYQIEWPDSPLSRASQSVEIEHRLCDVGQMRLRLTLPSEKILTLSTTDFPQQAGFKWRDRGLFKGILVRAGTPSVGRVELLYEDALSRSRKTYDNQFFKELSLQECLARLTKPLQLGAPIFQGDFSDKIPSVNLTGRSYFEHLQQLANTYGFFFAYRSYSGQMTFLRTGSTVRPAPLDGAKTAISGLTHSQGTESFYSQADIGHFDCEALGSKTKTVSGSELYAPAQTFSGHNGFQNRRGWVSAKGSIGAQAAQSTHFQSSDKLVAQQLAKQALTQDRLTATVFEPVGLPGDKLSATNLPGARFAEGDYLLESIRLRLVGALPQMEIRGIRA